MIHRLLEKYGQTMAFLDENGELIRRAPGFLQLLNGSDIDALWTDTPGGGVRREKYLLIAGEQAFSGDGRERYVEHAGRRYAVVRADLLNAIRGVVHWEAILRLEGRAEL